MTGLPSLPPLPPGYEPADPPPAEDWWTRLYGPNGDPVDLGDDTAE